MPISTDMQESAVPAQTGAQDVPNIGVIQAVTIVSPQNVKRAIPNKPKTVESVNLVNVKKTPVVMKGKQIPAHVPANNQQPLTLPEEMINRNTALTPSVYGDVEKSHMQQTSTVLSEENHGSSAMPPPRPSRRQHQSNDDRANHMPPQLGRPLNNAMNSTVNRGFNKPAPGLHPARTNMNNGSGGQINLQN